MPWKVCLIIDDSLCEPQFFYLASGDPSLPIMAVTGTAWVASQAGHKHKSTLQALLVFNQRRLVLQQTIIESRCISSISSWCGTPHSVSAQGHRTPEGPCCSVHSPFGNYTQDKFGQWVSRSAEDEMMSGRVRSLNLQG